MYNKITYFLSRVNVRIIILFLIDYWNNKFKKNLVYSVKSYTYVIMTWLYFLLVHYDLNTFI